MKVRTLGIDLAKSIFRLHGVDARGGWVHIYASTVAAEYEVDDMQERGVPLTGT
jgi:hypothetical protein